MPSPNLGLVTTDKGALDSLTVINDVIPDLLKIDQASGGLGSWASLLVNGGFEIDQRDAGPYSGDGTVTLDRWQIGLGSGPPTLTVQVVSQPDPDVDAGSFSAAKCDYAGTAGQWARLQQTVPQFRELWDLDVALRIRVRADAPCRAFVTDGAATTYSPPHSGGGEYETLTVAHRVQESTTLQAGVHFDQDATAYLDNATLVPGTTPLPYVTRPRPEDLLRCMRYYQIQGGTNLGHPLLRGYVAGVEDWEESWPWAVPFADAPSVSLVGSWTLTNCGAPSVLASNRYGYALKVTSVGAGAVKALPQAGASVIGTFNP